MKKICKIISSIILFYTLHTVNFAQSTFLKNDQNAFSAGLGIASLEDFSAYSGRLGFTFKGSINLGIILGKQISDEKIGIYDVKINSYKPYLNVLLKKPKLFENDLGIGFEVSYESSRFEFDSGEYLPSPNGDFFTRYKDEFNSSAITAALNLNYNIASSRFLIQPNFSVGGVITSTDENFYIERNNTFIYRLGLAIGKYFSDQIMLIVNPSLGYENSEEFFVGLTATLIFTTKTSH